jgi:hypothetical protein
MSKIYVKNSDLLREIHKSKSNYCSFIEQKYHEYHLIVSSLSKINNEKINIAQKNYTIKNGKEPENISDLVFRVITYSHIPENFLKSKKKNSNSIKLNFVPFKHYIIERTSSSSVIGILKEESKTVFKFKEVGRSHWKGDFDTGCFSTDHGFLTNNLALMIQKIVENYGQKSNWRGYTWLEDMKSHAMLQLVESALKFDETKSDNPFAYFTCIIANAFRSTINSEDKLANIKSMKLIEKGFNGSYNFQINYENENYDEN